MYGLGRGMVASNRVRECVYSCVIVVVVGVLRLDSALVCRAEGGMLTGRESEGLLGGWWVRQSEPVARTPVRMERRERSVRAHDAGDAEGLFE